MWIGGLPPTRKVPGRSGPGSHKEHRNRRRCSRVASGPTAFVARAARVLSESDDTDRPIVIGGKAFTEQHVLIDVLGNLADALGRTLNIVHNGLEAVQDGYKTDQRTAAQQMETPSTLEPQSEPVRIERAYLERPAAAD